MRSPIPRAVTEDCVEEIRHTKIKVEDGGRKAIILNSERAIIKKVTVDGCLITGPGLKADYVLSKPDLVDVIIELKGKDVPHAVEQIIATYRFWKTLPPFSPRVSGLIVCTRSPLVSSELQVIKAKALKLHDLVLIVDENGRKEYEFSIFDRA
jgi:hypothetical protein